MAFDYKKEYRELYQPPKHPTLVDVPAMHFLAVRGQGNPNEKGGAYKQAIGLLYGVAYTIKMSYKGSRQIEGFFEYVVPPLEGFWWQEGITGIDYARKDNFRWISLIRLPDFVEEADVRWAKEEAARKKKMDFSPVEFLPYTEGLCVQCMHIGHYDDEPETIRRMNDYAAQNGYAPDITARRYHHEIYLSDPRKANPDTMKTVVRCPVKATGSAPSVVRLVP